MNKLNIDISLLKKNIYLIFMVMEIGKERFGL